MIIFMFLKLLSPHSLPDLVLGDCLNCQNVLKVEDSFSSCIEGVEQGVDVAMRI